MCSSRLGPRYPLNLVNQYLITFTKASFESCAAGVSHLVVPRVLLRYPMPDDAVASLRQQPL